MYNEVPNDSIQIISQLPPNVIVHDMAFDWSGSRVAISCSDKTIKIFIRVQDKWVSQSTIKLQGAPVWKLKWARPQYGFILATCALDRTIRVYERKLFNRTGKETYEWTIQINSEGSSVQDFKFAPGNAFGLALAFVTSNGFLQVKSLKNSKNDKLKLNFHYVSKFQVSKFGLNCLSWSKQPLKKQNVLAIGCKSHETTPLKVLQGYKDKPDAQVSKLQPINTVAFISIISENGQELKKQKINVPAIVQKKSVNDISWALDNGRSYHLLGVATDSSLKIYQINLKQISQNTGSVTKTIEVLKQINLTQNTSYRLSWNIIGNMLSVSEQKKIRLFKSQSRGVWGEFKQIQDQNTH